MDRNKIKQTLVNGLQHQTHSYFDLDDGFRIYCYVEDSLGFWETYIHVAIDNNITRQIDIFSDDCDMCNRDMFEEAIDGLLDRYETELKGR